MTAPSLADVAAALRRSWSVETCDPADAAQWTPGNPSRGQCGVSALVVHDLLGGDLVLAVALWPDGTRQGHHYWNRLPDGTEIDLTRAQFDGDGVVLTGRAVVARPTAPPKRCREQYDLLRARVRARLAR